MAVNERVDSIAPQPSAASRRYAIVLAGGSGVRLWPLSRTTMPKQLLRLNGDRSLLQQTAERLYPMVTARRVVTVTHDDHRFEVAGQLHDVDPALAKGVLVEPCGRNTLPAIAWATARIARETPDALIGVFSSDHAIEDGEGLRKAWLAAERAADAGYLTLLGMTPSAPATGFGYIQAGEPLEDVSAGGGIARAVQRFTEKPDRASAERFIKEGGYYWNAGVFVFRADTLLSLLERLQPAVFRALPVIDTPGDPRAVASVYEGLPDISIDYGLLEAADKIAVVPTDIGWNDLGSFEALYQQLTTDDAGNVAEGDVVQVDSRGSLLWSEHGLLATLGVEDLVVVQTRDATLVCPRTEVGRLKELVAEVRVDHRNLTEAHTTVARPWGSYTVLEEGPRYKIKRIVVNPGGKLSMQMHYHRSEHWVVIAGTARICNGEQEIYLEENQSTYIPKAQRHRLENPGRIPLQIIEIQTGPYLEEDDIVRFGDDYGRG